MTDTDGPSKNEAESPQGSTVSQDEVIAANAIPAVFSDRIVATNMPTGMRLSFGERSPIEGQTSFRSSVFLSFEDAEALAALIGRQLSLLQKVVVTVGPDGAVTPVTK